MRRPIIHSFAGAGFFALLAIFSTPMAASASVLLSVDFDYTTSLQTQNGFSSLAAGLTDSTPQSITVGSYTVGVSGQDGFYNRGTVSNSGAFTYADLYNDFAYINAALNTLTTGTITISITGVTPDTPYLVTLYSYDIGNFGVVGPDASMATTFSPGAGTSGAPGTVTENLPEGTNLLAASPTSNDQYATTLALTGTGNVLNISASATATNFYEGLLRINGFELSAVPEPGSAVALLAIGGVLLRRRRLA